MERGYWSRAASRQNGEAEGDRQPGGRRSQWRQIDMRQIASHPRNQQEQEEAASAPIAKKPRVTSTASALILLIDTV